MSSVSDALAQAVAAAQTPAATNREPRFADDVAIRIVAENSPAGTLVGGPLTASDSDHDGLSYSPSGSDTFRIGASSGQLSVAEGAVLDYETQPAYTLTVGVSDGKNAGGGSDPSVDDTVEVVVSLSDVDETEPVQQVQQQSAQQQQRNSNFKITANRLVNKYRPELDPPRYHLTLVPFCFSSQYMPTVYEGHSVTGKERGVFFLDSITEDAKWVILDDDSNPIVDSHGFYLAKMDGTRYNDPNDWESHMAVHYDESGWPAGKLPSSLTVRDTNGDGDTYEVKVEVCLYRK